MKILFTIKFLHTFHPLFNQTWCVLLCIIHPCLSIETFFSVDVDRISFKVIDPQDDKAFIASINKPVPDARSHRTMLSKVVLKKLAVDKEGPIDIREVQYDLLPSSRRAVCRWLRNVGFDTCNVDCLSNWGTGMFYSCEAAISRLSGQYF
jgi:hypothetical protein